MTTLKTCFFSLLLLAEISSDLSLLEVAYGSSSAKFIFRLFVSHMKRSARWRSSFHLFLDHNPGLWRSQKHFPGTHVVIFTQTDSPRTLFQASTAAESVFADICSQRRSRAHCCQIFDLLKFKTCRKRSSIFTAIEKKTELISTTFAKSNVHDSPL